MGLDYPAGTTCRTGPDGLAQRGCRGGSSPGLKCGARRWLRPAEGHGDGHGCGEFEDDETVQEVSKNFDLFDVILPLLLQTIHINLLEMTLNTNLLG